MESFLSSLKTERTARKFYRTRDDAKADVFDYIERFYKPRRRLDTGLSEPRGIRRASQPSLTSCPPNRQQLSPNL
jgi:transposase InsO family protein